MSILYAIEHNDSGRSTVNFRAYEKEMAEKYFGKVNVCNLYNSDIFKFIDDSTTVIAWRPNTEWLSNHKYNLLIEKQNEVLTYYPKMNFINNAIGWKSCNCKITNFDIWKVYSVKTPDYVELKYDTDINTSNIRFDYPYIIRTNNECSGHCSYVISCEEDLRPNLNKLIVDIDRTNNERKNNTKALAVKFIENVKHGYRRSYRVIVAGNSVITGYARMCEPPDWIAIAGKYTPKMRDVFIEFNVDCEKFVNNYHDQIVSAVRQLNVNFVGVDILPINDHENYFLEVQPGFACGYFNNEYYKPPFYNPSYPDLVEFLIREKNLLQKTIPMYYNTWLYKDILFNNCFSEIRKSFNDTK